MRYFLNDLVEKVFQSLAPSGPIACQGVCEDIDLASNHALAIGMITNELVTNSLNTHFLATGRATSRSRFRAQAVSISRCPTLAWVSVRGRRRRDWSRG
jgi:two-component sensor histidine kinase